MFQREFRPDLALQTSPVASMYFDTTSKNAVGHPPKSTDNTTLEHVLKQQQIANKKYEIDFRSGIDLSHEPHRQYLEGFLDDTCNVLLDSLDKTEARLAIAPDPLNDEIKLHLAFAKLRAERFSPTGSSSAALDRAKEWMRELGGKTNVLYGPSGAGKTYVVAKLVVDLSTADSTTCVVRFLGTSGDSADVSSLLRSICHQLRTISMGKEAYLSGSEAGTGLAPCPAAHEDLVKYFNHAIISWDWDPLVLALESLDQLNDTNSGRKLDWLPIDGYSAKVKIVCSTLPDEPNPEVGRPFRCLSILRKRIPDAQRFVEVAALKDSALLIQHLLKLKKRTVTDSQLATLVQTMEKAEKNAKTPLMATLISGKASQWRSSTPLSGDLPSSVRGIILDFFGDLVSHFETVERTKQAGYRLVKHALSYITLVNKGVSDTELQEILSLDDDVLADSHLWWFTPDKRLPSAPLLLLLRMLAPYLSRRAQISGGALMVWYHRQLWEAAEAHFLGDANFRASCHNVLAEFFSGKFAVIDKPCNDQLRIRLGLSVEEAIKGVNRHVRLQPLAQSGESVFHRGATINERRCTEAMHHMVKELEILRNSEKLQGCIDSRSRIKNCSEMAEKELCSSEAVCARALAGETFNLVWQSATFLQLVSSEDIDFVRADHFNRWIRRDAHEFFCTGRLVASVLRQPMSSKARAQHLVDKPRMPGLPWLMLGGQSTDFDAVVSVLKGHEREVLCTDWHESGLVSGDGAGVIIVWDAFTGEKTLELRGHSQSVTSVRWSPKGDKIVSGSHDCSIIIWDVETGNKDFEMQGESEEVSASCCGMSCFSKSKQGHAGPVTSVAWSPKGDKILSGSYDKTCIIWDAATGDKVSELEGHTSFVMSVAWSPKGDQILSGSRDNTCIIWDAVTGDKITLLEGHAGCVNGVAWSGDQVVSCSDDKTLIIWDVASGKQVSKLEGHLDGVLSVAWNPVAKQLVSGSKDKTAIVWDTASGEKISELKGHTDWVRSVSWSDDGKQIATGSDDKTVLVWDAGKGQQVSKLEGHTDFVMNVAWSPSGNRLASGSNDKTAIVWDAEKGEQVEF